MVYIMVMTSGKATKLGHDQITRLEAFVDIQQSFSCIFRIKDGNDLSEFGRTEVSETQGCASSRYKLYSLFYSLR